MNKSGLINRLFYIFKPVIPRSVQLYIRRQISFKKRKKFAHVWPINYDSAKPPPGWEGWPENKRFAVVLTHDVESVIGHDKSLQLMEVDRSLGFKSSFNFVPERYSVAKDVRKILVGNGFEVGVHGLNHDGKLFRSKEVFRTRAQKINTYLKEWNAVGFRAPAMHHNLEWMHDLNIEYDLSTFDTDPFEPQSDGVKTIFPFFIQDGKTKCGYVEMPYTLPQDFLVFILMRERSCEIWKKKLDWIVENNGMMLINVHPDYICFEKNKPSREEFPVSYYEEFLKHINEKYQGQFWNALPKEVSKFWKVREFKEKKSE